MISYFLQQFDRGKKQKMHKKLVKMMQLICCYSFKSAASKLPSMDIPGCFWGWKH
jgi:hypothetical protein